MQFINDYDRAKAIELCDGDKDKAAILCTIWNAERYEDTREEIDDPRADDEWLDGAQ